MLKVLIKMSKLSNSVEKGSFIVIISYFFLLTWSIIIFFKLTVFLVFQDVGPEGQKTRNRMEWWEEKENEWELLEIVVSSLLFFVHLAKTIFFVSLVFSMLNFSLTAEPNQHLMNQTNTNFSNYTNMKIPI